MIPNEATMFWEPPNDNLTIFYLNIRQQYISKFAKSNCCQESITTRQEVVGETAQSRQSQKSRPSNSMDVLKGEGFISTVSEAWPGVQVFPAAVLFSLLVTKTAGWIASLSKHPAPTSLPIKKEEKTPVSVSGRCGWIMGEKLCCMEPGNSRFENLQKKICQSSHRDFLS